MQPLPAQKQVRVLSLGKNEEDAAPARRAAERLTRRYLIGKEFHLKLSGNEVCYTA